MTQAATLTSAPAPASLQKPSEPQADIRLLEPGYVGQNVSRDGNGLAGMTMA